MPDPFAVIAGELGEPGRRVLLAGASGGFSPFLLWALRRRLGAPWTERPLVAVCAGEERARELRDGLVFFHGAGSGFPEDEVRERIALVPGPDTSLYHQIAPSRFVVMERMAALFRLAWGMPLDFVVVPATALAPLVLPPGALTSAAERVVADGTLDREAFTRRLDDGGYARVPVVEDAGTYAVRGGIVDVFSPLYERPVRVDLFGDLVETLRFFDTESQRGGKPIREAVIPPVRDMLLTEATVHAARPVLRRKAGECGVPAPRARAILGELEAGIRPLGSHGWLPAFCEQPSQVGDYLAPLGALVVVEEPAAVKAAIEAQRDEAQRHYQEAVAQGRIAFEPDRLFGRVEISAQVELSGLTYEEDRRAAGCVVDLRPGEHHELRRDLEGCRGEDRAFEPAAVCIRQWLERGVRVLVVGASTGHAERLRGLLGHYGLKGRVREGPELAELLARPAGHAGVDVLVGDLPRGFVFEPLRLCVLGTEDLVPQRVHQASRSRARAVAAAALASFRDLSPGDLLVHSEHGIGRYEGLSRLTVEGVDGDYLKVVYKDDDLLYVPVHRLDRVTKYVAGEDASPALDRLGGTTWERRQGRARKAAEDMAKELIAVAAARAAREGYAYSPPGEYYEEFSAAFPHEETPDQTAAIGEVNRDMDTPRPMDRLVCGDVGYGKTEVALRAAFRAILDGKQVAVLVPTTVLAEQHRMTFTDRFRGYPVTVEALSRFRSPSEEREILERMRSSRLDIVIGTHRLLSRDVVFADLGLLVVDEEHRFGVRHKERLKQLKEMVDVLTLTATPIPRTLHMALHGLRDMSIIATPPTDRLSVRTLVSRVSDDVIREAILAETRRGGQVYFVHNRVQTIHKMAERVQRLVPKARLLVAHGQMDEGELERVMLAFMAGDADVLVCTTIIESGLDIPRANTMLIHRADTLGLAQLYQLRGRIGRSSERAFCYLLIPEPHNLTSLARRRVEAIQRMSELGAGFHVASMDMEIRGAGNLLGSRQSGHVKEVGLELFCELLQEAVQRLEGAAGRPVEVSCEMKVAIPAFLPETYVPDVNLRLWFYKRMASARTKAQLESAFEDLADRCGRLPPEASNLLDVAELKVACQRLGARTFAFSAGGLVLGLHTSSPLAGGAILPLIQRPGTRWRLTPEMELCRGVSETEWAAGAAAAREALRELLSYASKRGLDLPPE